MFRRDYVEMICARLVRDSLDNIDAARISAAVGDDLSDLTESDRDEVLADVAKSIQYAMVNVE